MFLLYLRLFLLKVQPLLKLILQLAVKEAIKDELIFKNPCEFVTLPKMKRHEPNFYTIGQLNELFTAIKDEQLYPLIYFTVIYGLRRSEVLGLKWDSINEESQIITIKHTVTRCTSIVEKDSTKTDASYRSYPITDEVRGLLELIKKDQENNKLLFGSEYVKNDYIFGWQDGRPYTPDYITRRFQTLLKKYNLPKIRFHDLRHSCASLLIANGFTLKDIQEWLGHSDIRVTANIYAHLDTERKKNIATSMSNTFSI